tara:strand:- start:424 stop:1812 length:1389 start_codon:yes stop_codon:yes gene_type:complete
MGYVSPSKQFYQDLFEENALMQFFEGKYSDEHAFRKQWNYFIKDDNPDAERIRDLLSQGEVEDAKSEMQRIVSDAQDEEDHPLHFRHANRGFEGGKKDSDKDSYNDNMKLVSDTIAAYSQTRRGKTALNSRLEAEVTGTKKPEVSSKWKQETGKKIDTKKGDILFTDKQTTTKTYTGQDGKEKKKTSVAGKRISLSLKQANSQTMSGITGETQATWKAAAQKTRNKMKNDGASEEELGEFDKDTESTLNKLKKAQDLGQRNPNFGSKAPKNGDKNPSERRSAVMQKYMDTYSQKYPEALKQFDKEAASGRAKFGKDQSKGRAQDVATHKHPKGWSDASAKDIRDRDITTDTTHAGPAARASKHPIKKDKDVHRLDTRKPVSTPSGPAVVTSRVDQQDPAKQNQSPLEDTAVRKSIERHKKKDWRDSRRIIKKSFKDLRKNQENQNKNSNLTTNKVIDYNLGA